MKPFELKNFKRVCDPTTFQPKIIGEIILSDEHIFNLEGLSKQTFNEEFYEHFINQYKSALLEYDSIVKEYHLVHTDITTSDDSIIPINASWIDLKIANTPCFKTFTGEPKNVMTIITSVIISKEEMLNIVDNPYLCKQYIKHAVQDVKASKNYTYYYESVFKYIQDIKSYSLYLRGC